MDRPNIEAIRLRADAATAAPWCWRGNLDSHRIRIAAVNARRSEKTVMDFARFGMRDAAPRFVVDGWHMRRADQFAVYEVCPEATSRDDPRVYRGDITGIRHPDAEFIAHARQDVEDLLAYVACLEASLLPSSSPEPASPAPQPASTPAPGPWTRSDLDEWRCPNCGRMTYTPKSEKALIVRCGACPGDVWMEQLLGVAA